MNIDILDKLTSAMKAITVSDLGEGVLVAEQFDRFVRAMQRRTNVLQSARFMRMDSQQVNIDRIGFAGRVITRGITAAGTARGTESAVKPAFNTNKLQAAEFRANTGLEDRALRRNIERGGLESTLVDLFGEAAGRDFEELSLLADTAAGDVILGTMDGWFKKAAAGNKITSGIDDTADTWPENLFEAMIVALPKQFLVDRAAWVLYVPWEIENAYRNKLRARGTQLGDTAQTGAPALYYKGFKIEVAAMLERDEVNDYRAMLTHPDNMVWGIFHEVTIEPKRVPEDRKTEFYMTMEGDAHYEDENAVVVASFDTSAS